VVVGEDAAERGRGAGGSRRVLVKFGFEGVGLAGFGIKKKELDYFSVGA
jgi:hypothetical protein